MIGEIVGSYRIIERLGAGTMGEVYRAKHLHLPREAAIKMLLPEVLELPEVVPRFEREARAAGKLRSDNTARVLDVDMSESGLPYMVMEFLDGNDLGKMLERTGALPVTEVGVRVRKPKVQLGGPLDYAGVEVWRRRSSS